jgi:hypothetical protein
MTSPLQLTQILKKKWTYVSSNTRIRGIISPLILFLLIVAYSFGELSLKSPDEARGGSTAELIHDIILLGNADTELRPSENAATIIDDLQLALNQTDPLANESDEPLYEDFNLAEVLEGREVTNGTLIAHLDMGYGPLVDEGGNV